MYLLDTNVISELRRPRPHGAVLAWFESVADGDLHISAVSLGEIQAAIAQHHQPSDAAPLGMVAENHLGMRREILVHQHDATAEVPSPAKIPQKLIAALAT